MSRSCLVFDLMHCSEMLAKPEASMIPTHEYSNKMLNLFSGRLMGSNRSTQAPAPKRLVRATANTDQHRVLC